MESVPEHRQNVFHKEGDFKSFLQEDQTLAAIRRSSATGLPYGDDRWVDRLARKLGLDLTIRPRGRPRKKERAE
jgi:hypothetical protein